MIQGANNKISTQRFTTASSKDTYPSGVYQLTNVDCYIEPISPEVAAIIDDQAAFMMYKCYIDEVTDVEIADKVIDKDSVEYIVKGVQKFTDNPEFGNYIEVVMVKKYAPN